MYHNVSDPAWYLGGLGSNPSLETGYPVFVIFTVYR
jgi:hypothetical protein